MVSAKRGGCLFIGLSRFTIEYTCGFSAHRVPPSFAGIA